MSFDPASLCVRTIIVNMLPIDWSHIILLLLFSLVSIQAKDDIETVTAPFRSRTELLPSKLNVTTNKKDNVTDWPMFIAPWSPGDIKKSQTFLGPHIFSSKGELIWTGYGYFGNAISNFMPFKKNDETHISFYEGNVADVGVGFGTFKLMNNKYEVTDRLGWKQGLLHDFHEFQMTGKDTAAFTTYDSVPHDLSGIDEFDGDNGWVFENVVTEVNTTNDEVVFQWRSLDHVPVKDSKMKSMLKDAGTASQNPFDYMHMNSINKDEEGNFLLSCRHLWSLYYVHGKTGKLIWSLGSSEGGSDWELGEGVEFAYQHDARWVKNPEIIGKKKEKNVRYMTIFDNSQAGGNDNYRDYSRGILLKLDNSTDATNDKNKVGKVTLVHEYKLPQGIKGSESQGSIQILNNSNVFLGWGSNPMVSEHKLNGDIVFQATINNGEYGSYRAFKMDFEGNPQEKPALVSVYSKDDNKTTCYISWNGETKVDKWKIYSGHDNSTLLHKADNSDSFETVYKTSGKHEDITIHAMSSNGSTLATKHANTREMHSLPEQDMPDDGSTDGISGRSLMTIATVALMTLLLIL